MKDIELLIGIFNMVGMILEHITGKLPILYMKSGSGDIYPVYYNNADISLIIPTVEVANLFGVPEVLNSTCCSTGDEPDAKQKESQQPVGLSGNPLD
jgi:hypothetical protein